MKSTNSNIKGQPRPINTVEVDNSSMSSLAATLISNSDTTPYVVWNTDELSYFIWNGSVFININTVPALSAVLNAGNDASGILIQLNGGGGYLVGTLDGLGAVDVKLRATGTMTLETSKNIVNFKGSVETLRHDISALDGLGASSPIVVTWQNKPITVAGLDDIAQAIDDLIDTSPAALDTLNELAAALGNDANFATTVNNAIAARLKLDGSTPMTGDLDMTTNNVAVKTDNIKTTGGILNWLAGIDSLIHDFSAWIGGGASFTQTWRAKNGTVAHLDDSHYYVVGVHNEDVSHMGTSEAVLATILIPADTYIADDMFILDVINGKIGNTTGNCFVKCYINTSPNLVGSPQMIAQQQFNATHKSGGTGRKMLVRGGSLINAFTASNTFENYYQRTINSPNLISSLDFTTDQYLVITGVSGDAADGAVFHSCVLSRLRKTD